MQIMYLMLELIRIFFFFLCCLQVRVREGGTDWGWGVVVNVLKNTSVGSGTLTSRGGGYIVDTLLQCSPVSSENTSRPKPCPARPGEKGEMHVVSMCAKHLLNFLAFFQFNDSFLLIELISRVYVVNLHLI